jgi:hypothetical protein
MGRKQAFKRSRAVPIVVAGFVGYVLGSWNAATPRGPDLSAAQTVAQRFPQGWDNAAAMTAVPAAFLNASTMRAAELALLNPEPMVGPVSPANPQAAQNSQASVPDASAAPAVQQSAAAEQSEPPAAPPRELAPAKAAPAAAQSSEAKPIAPPVRHRAERPGFVLNEAQIASIKERLHLTADQERMWPAVEAALRNFAYTKARDAHEHGAAQVAAADPNSVQGLKSAAIPLLMSFNSEQKDEVRNLAHVMGLDQLANEF